MKTDHRVVIYLDDARYQAALKEARQNNLSLSAYIRGLVGEEKKIIQRAPEEKRKETLPARREDDEKERRRKERIKELDRRQRENMKRTGWTRLK